MLFYVRLFFVIFFFFQCQDSFGDTGIPVDVRYVEQVGYWRGKFGSGPVRIAVSGFESARVSVEWLNYKADSNALELVCDWTSPSIPGDLKRNGSGDDWVRENSVLKSVKMEKSDVAFDFHQAVSNGGSGSMVHVRCQVPNVSRDKCGCEVSTSDNK